MANDDIWFRYWPHRGGVRAAPVSWQGWTSMLGSLAAWLTIGVGLYVWVGPLADPLFAGVSAALLVFGGMTVTTVALIKFKGRKA